MREFLFAAALGSLAMPALAQDGPAYDDALLTACFERVAAAETAGDATAEPASLHQCIGTAADACMDGPDGDTTVGMVLCLGHETREWDRLLNDWYGAAVAQVQTADAELEKLGSSAPPAGPSLRDAQRNWIAFRDASCEFESVRWQGGTAGGPASAQCMLELTAAQALRLKSIAEGP